MNDRCIAILKLLQNGTFIKRQTLMDEFCVSERTIRRDIEFLAYHYNIQSFYGRYGGYKLLDMDDYKEKKKENKRIKVDTLKEILRTCSKEQVPIIESIISDYINKV
ncbi:MAG: DeoR family transcriptional regulator [Clostridia bacterium]|nr:DeoR family transcriptional regulator [Clostridia bacterium]